MRNLIAASLIATAVPFAALANTVTVDCSYGELTIERLADGSCMSRIPVPAVRPDIAVQESAQSTRAEPENFHYIQTPDPETGAVRTVRIVGPTYLPEDNDAIEFKRQASIIGNPLNAAFSTFAAAFGIGSAQANEPGDRQQNTITIDNSDSEMERLEARADIRVLAAHLN
jgi:hypothetical protein